MTQDNSDLNHEAIAIWEQMAPWWESQMGEDGNRTHRRLVAPTTERLLDISAGEVVLEAACGAGILRDGWPSWERPWSLSTQPQPSSK